MRKLLRSMAKAEMVRRGYSKVNRRIGYGSWRAVINAYPINLVTGNLWVLHEQFGFGAQRLRTYYDAFHDRIKELVSRYEMEDQDDIWLCTQMLKRIGVDIEAWHKESDHGT